MKLLISGGRNNHLSDDGYHFLDQLHLRYHFDELVNGMATGIDECARIWAKDNNIPIKEFKPDWNNIDGVPKIFIKTNRYGKLYNARAGLERNISMIQSLSKGDIAVFFAGGTGTMHALMNAQKRDDIEVIDLMDRYSLIQ